MPDIMFPAKVVITREVDIYGLPITTAQLELDEAAAALPLPSGREGDQGQRGRPRATWVKRGTVTNASALTVLDPADRDFGHWWHNLATGGMETWTEIGWVPSPGAVGASGPVAPPYSLTVTDTASNPKISEAGARIADPGPDQSMKVTVPAGVKGDQGPYGSAGLIRASGDYDDTIGPVNGSVFGWNRGTNKFRPLPFPNGFGPWTTASTDFAADASDITDGKRVMATLTIPGLPFAWRPLVHGAFKAAVNGNQGTGFVHAFVRMGTENGPICALGLCEFWGGGARERTIAPHFSQRLSPSSTVGVVNPLEDLTLYLCMERQGADQKWIWKQQPGYLSCYALPVT